MPLSSEYHLCICMLFFLTSFSNSPRSTWIFSSKMTLQFSVEAKPREVWKSLGLATWAVAFHLREIPLSFCFYCSSQLTTWSEAKRFTIASWTTTWKGLSQLTPSNRYMPNPWTRRSQAVEFSISSLEKKRGGRSDTELCSSDIDERPAKLSCQKATTKRPNSLCG